jgi:hypothetical protein
MRSACLAQPTQESLEASTNGPQQRQTVHSRLCLNDPEWPRDVLKAMTDDAVRISGDSPQTSNTNQEFQT